MAPGGIIPALDELEDDHAASGLVCNLRRSNSSRSSVAMKLSHMALSPGSGVARPRTDLGARYAPRFHQPLERLWMA